MSANDTPEELIDVFRAAALSVTQLYKASASAQAKARADGYQDCLEDLLSFLDKDNIGLGDGEGSKIRKWIASRADRQESTVPATIESDDEGDKVETASSPELHRASSNTSLSGVQQDAVMRNDSAPPAVEPIAEVPEITVPVQETFNFQTSIPYPQDTYPELDRLALSDIRPSETSNHSAPPTIAVSRSAKARQARNIARPGSRASGYLGGGAGQKRKTNLNLPEIFDLGSLGFGKDGFGGRSNKRNRHS